MTVVPPTGNETTMSWWWFFLLLLLGLGGAEDPIDPAQENPIRKAITPYAWVAPG